MLLSFSAIIVASLLAPRFSAQSLNSALVSEKAVAASGAKAQGTWEISGNEVINGVHEKFQLYFDDQFRFKLIQTGPESEIDAFDGKVCWTKGVSGIAHIVKYQGRDTTLLDSWLFTGQWALPKSGVQLSGITNGEKSIDLSITPQEGVVTASLSLNKNTYLPSTMKNWTPNGEEVWTLSRFHKFNGRTLPTLLEDKQSGMTSTFTVKECHLVADPDIAYGFPKPDDLATSFVGKLPATIQIQRIYGYTFVKPLVNGEDVGWFIFDSGADSMCISPDAAKKLKLKQITKIEAVGVVATSKVDLCKGKTFQLGPVSYQDPQFAELPFISSLSSIFKIPIGGICGYDILSRAEYVIDPTKSEMVISKPNENSAPSGSVWVPIDFASNTPLVHFTFQPLAKDSAPVTGIFSIDTGANSSIDFFTPAVKKYQLDAGQTLLKSSLSGAGGSANGGIGKVAWFEAAGKKFVEPMVGFMNVQVGGYASPYQLGNIGQGILSKFIITLDYANNRIGFCHLPDTSGSVSPYTVTH